MGQKSEKFTMVKTKKSCDTVPLRTRVSELEEKKKLNLLNLCEKTTTNFYLVFIRFLLQFSECVSVLTIFVGFQLCYKKMFDIYSLFLVLGSSQHPDQNYLNSLPTAILD